MTWYNPWIAFVLNVHGSQVILKDCPQGSTEVTLPSTLFLDSHSYARHLFLRDALVWVGEKVGSPCVDLEPPTSSELSKKWSFLHNRVEELFILEGLWRSPRPQYLQEVVQAFLPLILLLSGFSRCEAAFPLLKLFLALLQALHLENEWVCLQSSLLKELKVLPIDQATAPMLRFKAELLQSTHNRNWPASEAAILLEAALKKTPKEKKEYRAELKDQLRWVRHLRGLADVEAEILQRWKEAERLEELIPERAFDSVPRMRAEDLSFETFFKEYAMLGRPLVIEGLDRSIGIQGWEEVKLLCGSMPIAKLSRFDGTSLDWAKMELRYDNTSLKDWMVAVESSDGKNGTWALFDRSLRSKNGCPALLEKLVIPKYFTMDYFKRLSRRDCVRRLKDPFAGHPSIFVQPSQTRSGWHVDKLASHFWQFLVHGRKRWRLLPLQSATNQAVWLCNRPQVRYSVNQGSHEDLKNPKLVRYMSTFPEPDARHACPLWNEFVQSHLVEVETKAGDVIFVPGGTPHQVDNLNRSLALSMNYVDASNLPMSLKEMQHHEGLHLQKALDACKPPTVRWALDLPWQILTAQRPWEAYLSNNERLFPEQIVSNASELLS